MSRIKKLNKIVKKFKIDVPIILNAWGDTAFYSRHTKAIHIDAWILDTYSDNALGFILLHEAGHHQDWLWEQAPDRNDKMRTDLKGLPELMRLEGKIFNWQQRHEYEADKYAIKKWLELGLNKLELYSAMLEALGNQWENSLELHKHDPHGHPIERLLLVL